MASAKTIAKKYCVDVETVRDTVRHYCKGFKCTSTHNGAKMNVAQRVYNALGHNMAMPLENDSMILGVVAGEPQPLGAVAREIDFVLRTAKNL